MRPIITLLLLLWPGWLAAQNQPLPARIDVQHYDIELEVIPENSYLRGKARVRFQVQEEAISVPFELNNRISLIQVKDEQGVIYTPSFDNFNSSRMRVRGNDPFLAGSERTLEFEFDGTLESEEYAYLDDTPRIEKAVISRERALLLQEGNWFPNHQIEIDPATATLQVKVPLGMTVVAPGSLDTIETVGISEVFHWKSDYPITRIPVAINRYFRQQFDEGPLPLTFYVSGEAGQDLQPWAEQAGEIIEFFSREYGPLTAPQRINLVDVGNVQLPSNGALGLILMDSKFFKAPSLPVVELARRIAYQWWGYNLFVAGGQEVWLQDGFANYAALRFVEEKLPERYEAELAKLSIQALKYEQRAPISNGLQLERGSPQYESIVTAKGAWVLYMLRQLIGPDQFHTLLRDWFVAHQGEAATTSELADLVNQRTGDDYRWFFVQWVESIGVPEFKLEYSIFKRADGNFRVRGQVAHELELFRMPLEIAVETKGEPEQKQINLVGKQTSFDFTTETMPLKITLDPKGKILRDSEQTQVAVYIALGEEYQNLGEYVPAIREFEKAKTIDPRSSYAHYRLGETFFLQHSYSSAANSFRDALNGDLKPEWVETWSHIQLGKIYDILGQRQRALAEYTKAVNLGIDYNGAQAEAQKYMNEPFSKPKTLIN